MPGANKLYIGRNTAMSGGLGANILSAPNGSYIAAPWTANAVTQTAGQTDPFGGTTANLLTDTAAAAAHDTTQAAFVLANTRYFVSIYFKAGTFANGIDVDAGQTNGGGTVHISNAGALTNLSGTSITNLNVSTVGGFFYCNWVWVPLLSGSGLFTISFGIGTDNAPLSYTGTLQNCTVWGASLQQVL